MSRVLTIHDTVDAAGANTVLVNIGDLSNSRAMQTAFPDLVGRARVTAEISLATGPASGRRDGPERPIDRLVWIRTTSERKQLDQQHGQHQRSTLETWNYTDNFSNPNHWFENSTHAGSVYHGLCSNMLKKGMNFYGANLTPFTDQEIFAIAGLTGFPTCRLAMPSAACTSRPNSGESA